MSKFLITLSNFYLLLHRFVMVYFLVVFFGALITSNYSFCLIFCFLLGCSCMLRCVVFVLFSLCTVLLFTVSCLLGQFHVFLFVCYYLFFFCWAVSVRIERGPWTCFSFRWFACVALDLLLCFISNYSFLLDQLLLVV